MKHADDRPHLFAEPDSTAAYLPPLLLTAAEAAATCRTSVRTWRSWDAAGRVPRAIRIGRAKMWRPQELADWIAEGCPARALWRWEPRQVPAA